MRTRRSVVAVVLSLAAVAGSCGSSGFDEAGRAGSVDQPAIEVPPDRSGVGEMLRSSGIVVVSEPTPGEVAGFEMTEWQIENQQRQAEGIHGYLGGHLDQILPSPGGMPFSFLLASWIDGRATPNAESAARIMGSQDWTQSPSIVFPTAVLSLFVADALASLDSGPAPPAEDAAAGADAAGVALIAAPRAQQAQAPQGVCSALAEWFNRVLDFVFDSLKFATDDGGFFGFLASLWNAAVDFARSTVGGLVETLAAPLVAVIAEVVAVIGTISMVASLLVPWTIDVSIDTARSRFAVGVEPDITHIFVARVDTNLPVEWPADVSDCAATAGFELPDPASAEGARILWRTSGIPAFGTFVGTADAALDSDNAARLPWATGREPDTNGQVEVGVVSATASVPVTQVEELRKMLANLIAGAVPAGPLGEIVGEAFAALAGPVFDELVAFTEVSGSADVRVEYHGEEEPGGSVTSPGPGDPSAAVDSCLVGSWVSHQFDMPVLGGGARGGAGASMTIATDGTVLWMFDGMDPLIVPDPGVIGFSAAGRASGRIAAADGDWTLIALDSGAMQSVEIVNGAEFTGPPPGPGLFLGLGAEQYICEDGGISLLTIFDGFAVPVFFGPEP